MKYKAYILLISFLIAGCTMVPKYERPSPPVPERFAITERVKNDEAVLPQALKWKDFYVDQRLNKVIDLALKNNRDLRITALNIEMAQGAYSILKRTIFFPNVNLIGNYTEQRVPADLSTKDKEAYLSKQYGVNLGITAWEIDFFGRLRSLKDRALEQYMASEYALKSATLALVAEVANAYFTLAYDKENLRLAREMLKIQEEVYNLIKRRYDAGTASELELNQARARLEQIRLDIPKYERQISVDENALNLLVGTTVPKEYLPESLDTVTPPKAIFAGLSSDVLLSRPDILYAESMLKAANANIGAARAAFFPTITLTTSMGTVSEQLSNLFTAGARTWTFVPQVTQPIFDAGTRWVNLKIAHTEREMYLAQYEKAIQAAFREVSDAIAQKNALEEQYIAQKNLVEVSEKTFKLADIRYNKGVDNYLTVLDAQRGLYSAQQGLIGIRLLKLINQVTLYKVLGGGSKGS